MRHVPLLVLLSAALLSGCSRESRGGAPTPLAGTLERHELPRVRVQPVERREMKKTLQTSTVVRSEREIAVLPQASGIVQELLVEESDAVAAGEVLCVLDRRDAEAAASDARTAHAEALNGVARAAIASREAQAALDSAKLAWDQAERDYQRNEKSRLLSAQELERLALTRDQAERTHVSSQLALDRARNEETAAGTAVERAALALERAELSLSYTEIRAPFAGRIAERFVSQGDNVAQGTTLFTLTDLDSLIAVVLRPQRELGLFARAHFGDDADSHPLVAAMAPSNGASSGAMEIHAEAEALPGRRFPGEVLRLSPAIDPESGSFRVTVRLSPDASGVQLLPGMLVRLDITIDRHADALVVPKRALRREGERRVLFVVRDGVARRVPVDEGYSDEDSVEVTPAHGTELLEGEEIIVVGNRDLEDGDAVDVAREADERVEAAADGTEAGADGTEAGADGTERSSDGDGATAEEAEASGTGAGAAGSDEGS